ncbi:MAG: helix-turn-helix transcriptional regulator [Chloroflexota bacterium]
MQTTRWQIVEILKRRGRATVDDLSKELGITLMAVRLHLVVLERDGLAVRKSVREGPGRPALHYSLTAAAEETFPKRYDALASNLLATAKAQLDAEAFDRLLYAAAVNMAQQEKVSWDEPDLGRRVEVAASYQAEAGNPGFAEPAEEGYFWHRYSCPFFRVAQVHPEVCALHRQALGEALCAEVHSLLQGEGRCSFLVRERVPASLEALLQSEVAR